MYFCRKQVGVAGSTAKLFFVSELLLFEVELQLKYNCTGLELCKKTYQQYSEPCCPSSKP